MSQDNTRAAQSIAAVEVTTMLVNSLSVQLERLDDNRLSASAIRNMKRLVTMMWRQLDDLERSTYKLLD